MAFSDADKKYIRLAAIEEFERIVRDVFAQNTHYPDTDEKMIEDNIYRKLQTVAQNRRIIVEQE